MREPDERGRRAAGAGLRLAGGNPLGGRSRLLPALGLGSALQLGGDRGQVAGQLLELGGGLGRDDQRL